MMVTTAGPTRRGSHCATQAAMAARTSTSPSIANGIEMFGGTKYVPCCGTSTVF
jgi:hypothetical protein